MVGHQAVAEQAEGVSVLGRGEGLEEGEMVFVIGEDGGAGACHGSARDTPGCPAAARGVVPWPRV